ncbi:hypothetical protein Poly30_13010 [Planctomycetes bacterium Poly30]|uniref:Metallo-beta-lactamase domain-containing protein n=1 Tax=Saltatorellus ferox TaxID=2528018 RepID=A0A518ENY9_9BACT|nr:hypothetical protein Poly30_13010 [Planctomycetes bacterium Poly30]
MIHLAASLLVTSAMATAQNSPLQEHIEDCERGRATLESLCEHLAPPRHRMQATVETRSVSLRHGRRPDDHGTSESISDLRVFEVSTGAGSPWRVDVEMRASKGGPGARLRINDFFAIQDRADSPGAALDSADALRAQLVQRAAFPATLAHYLCTAGRVLNANDTAAGGVDVLVALEGGKALVRTIPVHYSLDESDVEVPGLVGVDWMTSSELLGDVVESLTYLDAPPIAPGVVGGWTITGPLGTGEIARITDVDLDSKVEPFAGGLFPDPEAAESNDADPSPIIELRELSAGAFELLIAKEAARSVAVDLGPGWAVLEAPVSSTIGEELIRALEREKPGHPFLYAAASHHHPHYIGALRPFVLRGATIVCPADVADYVEHVLSRPRTLKPDSLARSPKPVKIVGVEPEERWAPREAPGRLIAAEAAGHSAHTEAFMLFFLPEHQLAFGGDLLWLSNEESLRGPNPRTLGLKKILSDAEDLQATEFLTSWPAGGTPMRGQTWKDRVPIAEILAVR